MYIINSIIATLLIFSYLSPFVDPSTTGFFAIFGLFYPLILFANILFIVIWLIVEPKKALLSTILIAVGISPLFKTIGFNTGSNDPQQTKVITYNIGKTRVDFKRKDKDKHINTFKTFIKNENPDIICVQERLRHHLDIYEDIFADYNVYPNSEIGTAIYSKYPIVNGGNMPFETIAHNATWADLLIHSDTIRYYSIHFSSNRITKLTGEMLENPDISNTEIWQDLQYILAKYNEHAQLRSKQMDQVLTHSLSSPHPVVISGDFNDVPQSYLYRKIKQNYCDAFMDCGSGMMKTFISFMPGLRIDYTFLDPKIKVLDHYTINTAISDHYPVVTMIDHLN